MKKKVNKIIYFSLAGILLAALLATAVITIVKRVKKAHLDNLNRGVVLVIGDEEIGKDEFVLSCVTVIEGESFEEISKEADVENAVKDKAITYLCERVMMTGLAENAGVLLSERDILELTAEIDARGDDDYYRKNFGVDKESYKAISIQWKKCAKYMEKVVATENNAALEDFEKGAKSLFDTVIKTSNYKSLDISKYLK